MQQHIPTNGNSHINEADIVNWNFGHRTVSIKRDWGSQSTSIDGSVQMNVWLIDGLNLLQLTGPFKWAFEWRSQSTSIDASAQMRGEIDGLNQPSIGRDPLKWRGWLDWRSSIYLNWRNPPHPMRERRDWDSDPSVSNPTLNWRAHPSNERLDWRPQLAWIENLRFGSNEPHPNRPCSNIFPPTGIAISTKQTLSIEILGIGPRQLSETEGLNLPQLTGRFKWPFDWRAQSASIDGSVQMSIWLTVSICFNWRVRSNERLIDGLNRLQLTRPFKWTFDWRSQSASIDGSVQMTVWLTVSIYLNWRVGSNDRLIDGLNLLQLTRPFKWPFDWRSQSTSIDASTQMRG